MHKLRHVRLFAVQSTHCDNLFDLLVSLVFTNVTYNSLSSATVDSVYIIYSDLIGCEILSSRNVTVFLDEPFPKICTYDTCSYDKLCILLINYQKFIFFDSYIQNPKWVPLAPVSGESETYYAFLENYFLNFFKLNIWQFMYVHLCSDVNR